MAIQLEEFAKQVLFGTTIEEKLSVPREEIVDTKRSVPIATPRTLSRPAHLQLREDGVKATHPAEAKLVDERERGRLLHFFGNHELLATELMALAILKFPDAPASFRRGLLETLKDEQVHTRMYMHRMSQCGVEFGELPLGDYFWRSVSSMEDPLDCVTRLSLTFEQANLDYSREYGKIFADVGDRSTGAILDKIYRDEIDHVGFGLKWFRRWKAEGKTDWEAFRERLVFPLSPARAKGQSFNRDGRKEVGLDESFINQLQVFSQSRGRTPYVYWFNPEAEKYAAIGELAEGRLPESVVRDDLSFLPAYLSRRDDILVTSKSPVGRFLQSVQEAGVELPEICDSTFAGNGDAPVIDRKIGGVRPWAWTPDSVSYFRNTLHAMTQPIEVESLWSEAHRELFSKAWSAQLGAQLAEENSDWLAPKEVYGRCARSIDEVVALREEYRKKGYQDLALKAPFGTAAQGIRCWFAGDRLEGRVLRWLEKVLVDQGSVIVEPWLNRVFDFSVQYDWRESRLRTLGYTRLINNARGQFKGIVTDAFCDGLEPALVRFLMQRVEDRPRAYHWFETVLLPKLTAILEEIPYRGPLGVDAFVYRSVEGGLRLKPIVEVNPRYTMGRIAYEIGKRNAATSVGYFQILNSVQLKKLAASTFTEYAERVCSENRVRLSEEKKPRIVEGSLALTEPGQAQRFLALYHVRKSFEALPL